MKITAIKEQAQNPERVSIFVDGKYSFSLTLNELLSEKLRRDVELDDHRLRSLKKLSEEGKLKMRALAWLMSRPHSIREFKDYLYRKKASPEQIAAWTEEFLSRGHLDDLSFARWWSEQRSANKRSNRFIQSELYKKGVAKDIIETVLGGSESNERDRLVELVQKKRRLGKYASDPTKLMQYLVRQGYSYSLVKEAVGGTPDGEG